MKTLRAAACLLLTVYLCSAAALASASFTDVPAGAWYYEPVMLACAEGLMDGVDEGVFSPDGSLSLAQAVTMAARARSGYLDDGHVFDQSEGPYWWHTYESYAIDEGIIAGGVYADLSRGATRADMARIFAHALPESAFPAINAVTALPDVSEGRAWGREIYLLYRAGVLEGDDEYGLFRPCGGISRGEAAAIITRVLLPGERRHTALKTPSSFSEYDYQSGGGLLYTKKVTVQSADMYTEEKYRADGTLWVHRTCASDGSLLNKTVFHEYGSSYGMYDSCGRLTRGVERDTDGKLSYYTIFKYGAGGELTGESSYDSDGTLTTFYEYEYGPDGRLSAKAYYGEGRRLIFFWRYSCASGDDYSAVMYNADGSEYNTERHIYSGERLLRSYYYESGGALRDYMINVYDGERPVRTEHYDGAGALTLVEEFDADGDRLKYTYYGPDGDVQSVRLYLTVIRMKET